jgi:hypothetical protein
MPFVSSVMPENPGAGQRGSGRAGLENTTGSSGGIARFFSAAPIVVVAPTWTRRQSDWPFDYFEELGGSASVISAALRFLDPVRSLIAEFEKISAINHRTTAIQLRRQELVLLEY